MPKHRGHNEGSIFQRKQDGLWVASVTVGRDPAGKVKKRRFYGKTRKEVQDKLVKLLADAQKGIPLDPTRETVGTFLTQFLDNLPMDAVRPRTLESYRGILKHIIPEIGDIPLTKLTPSSLLRLYRVEQDKGLTRTVVLTHALLRRGLGQAERWGLIYRNPATLVDVPKVPKRETRTLSPEEVQKLLTAAETDRLCALYVLAATCGLRQGELLGLKWEDVDAEKGTLAVRRQLQWLKAGQGEEEKRRPTLTEPKSAKSRRTISLPGMAVAALGRHHARQAAEHLRAGQDWNDTGLVFTTTIGTPLNPSGVRQRSFEPLLERAGLPHVKFHSLRHFCASGLAAQGVSPRVAGDILGHSQIRTVLDVYTHATSTAMREAAAAMDALLDRPKDAGSVR